MICYLNSMLDLNLSCTRDFRNQSLVGTKNYSAQFIKIISHYKNIDYNIDVLRQTACFVG